MLHTLALLLVAQLDPTPTPLVEPAPVVEPAPAPAPASVEPVPAPVPAAAVIASPPTSIAAAVVAPVETPTRDWSVGAGLFTTFSSGLGGSLGVASLFTPSVPGVRATVERRITDSLWLEVDVAGSAAQGNATNSPSESLGFVLPTSSTSSSWLLSAGAGVRWSFFQSEHVVLSAHGILGGAVADAQQTSTLSVFDATSSGFTDATTNDHSTTWSGGVTAGGSVDIPFADVLSVRFASDVLSARYAGSSVDRIVDAGAPIHGDSNDLSAGLDLRPSLQLRAFF